MLRIEDACAPGDKGLLNPVLQRYQAGAGTLEIFGLPAVQVVVYKQRSPLKTGDMTLSAHGLISS